MRLVINNRQHAATYGLKRYKGDGIFSSIGRKLLSSAINISNEANLPQKIANAVVNGALSTGKQLGQKAGNYLAVNKITKKRVGTPLLLGKQEEAAAAAVPPLSKKSKQELDKIINGSGIVFE